MIINLFHTITFYALHSYLSFIIFLSKNANLRCKLFSYNISKDIQFRFPLIVIADIVNFLQNRMYTYVAERFAFVASQFQLS